MHIRIPELFLQSPTGLFLVQWFPYLVFVALLALYASYKQWTDPLAPIPTIHWSAPFSRSYVIWQAYQNGSRYAHYDAHVKHDGEILPIIRVAPNEISIMTIQGIRRLYDGGFDRTSHYTAFQIFG